MEPTDRQQLDATIAALQHVAPDTLAGIYGYGSSVIGGLRRFSDLDVFAIVDTPTTPGQRQGLVARLLEISTPWGPPGQGRPIELTIVRSDLIRPWPDHPYREFQYGEWLRGDYLAGTVPDPAPDDDLAALVTSVLTASTAHLGPPAGELLAPVPHDRLIAAMVASIPSLVDDLDDDTVNVLLTLARIWFTIDTGAITTKDAAAAWAVARMPSSARGPLEQARLVYLDSEGSPQSAADDARATADALVDAITDAQGRGE